MQNTWRFYVAAPFFKIQYSVLQSQQMPLDKHMDHANSVPIQTFHIWERQFCSKMVENIFGGEHLWQTMPHCIYTTIKSHVNITTFHSFTLLFKFRDFNQLKASTEIFPDAVVALMVPLGLPMVPKDKKSTSYI